jgi:hypothetical protein
MDIFIAFFKHIFRKRTRGRSSIPTRGAKLRLHGRVCIVTPEGRLLEASPCLALHSSHLISSPLDIYKYMAKECGLFVSAILVGCFSCGAQCAKEIVLLQKLSLNFVKSPRECSRIHRKVTLRRARVYCRLLEGCHPPRRMYPGGSNVHP